MPDVTVIGGGPAGAAAAIRLRQIGLQVKLYEKARFPRPKLCGGFLSSECLVDLDELGVLPAIQAAEAVSVNRVRICSPRGIQAEAAFQEPGLSLSRDRLDTILLQRAREVGVDVQEGADGTLHHEEGNWTIIASGRNASRQRGFPGIAYYGVQAFFEGVEGVSDQVELDLMPGGYVGFVKQGSQLTNICALTTQGILQTSGPSLDAVLTHWAKQNPTVNRHICKARRVSAWQAIGPVTMGFKQLYESHRLYVGDAACVVDPFAGEGIAMGLKCSALLQNAFSQTAEPITKIYAQSWHQTFDWALRVDGWLRFVVRHPALQELCIGGMRTYPALLSWLTELTRPRILYGNSQPDTDCRVV